jgi:hypothetical protein
VELPLKLICLFMHKFSIVCNTIRRKEFQSPCTSAPCAHNLGAYRHTIYTSYLRIAVCLRILLLSPLLKASNLPVSVFVFATRSYGRRILPLNFCVQTGSGDYPATCPMGTGGPFPWGKLRPGMTLTSHPI